MTAARQPRLRERSFLGACDFAIILVPVCAVRVQAARFWPTGSPLFAVSGLSRVSVRLCMGRPCSGCRLGKFNPADFSRSEPPASVVSDGDVEGKGRNRSGAALRGHQGWTLAWPRSRRRYMANSDGTSGQDAPKFAPPIVMHLQARQNAQCSAQFRKENCAFQKNFPARAGRHGWTLVAVSQRRGRSARRDRMSHPSLPPPGSPVSPEGWPWQVTATGTQ